MSQEPPPGAPEDDVLDVDLDAEDFPPVAAAPPLAEEGVLVIDHEHLTVAPPAAGKAAPGKPGAGPDHFPVVDTSSGPDLPVKGKGAGAFVAPDALAVMSLVLAGAIGGAVAWLMSEPFIDDPPMGAQRVQRLLIVVLGSMGLFAACAGGFIGLALGAVEGIASRAWEKMGWGATWGLLIGGAGGFVGGVIGQVLYGAFGGGDRELPFSTQMVVRGLAWMLVGACVGLGQGAAGRAQRKMVNGLIGGLIGGLVGGLLFDPLGKMVAFMARLPGGTVGGELSRLVALAVLGAACGLAIALVEQARKEAWLRIVEGPLTGKQFILYKSPTILGSSPKCDITLALDKGVAAQHAALTEQGGHYIVADLDTAAGTRVNGRPTRSHRLRSGDLIGIGRTSLQYSERGVR